MKEQKIILQIHDLTLDAILGFYPEERQKKQKIIINISFEVNEPKSLEYDDVSYTVNYAELAEEIYEKVSKSEFNLLESLARFVMDIIMKRPQVQAAEIEIRKPDAPLPHTRGSSVRMAVRK